MDSTVPADLLKLKDRLEAWRATRKYARQPIPDEFRQAAADMAGRYSPSLVRRILKLDPWQLNKRTTKKPDRSARVVPCLILLTSRRACSIRCAWGMGAQAPPAESVGE